MAPYMPPECHNINNVTPECPAKYSIYGYYPSLPANAFFCAFFGIALAVQLVQGYRYRTWTFMLALSLGCLAEAIGYVGRILLHSNPYSNAGFEMQICCLILAPAFLAAGIYLTLKHLVIAFDVRESRIPARYYTWIFILCDLLSLILQAAGGAIAATSNSDYSKQKIGNDLMMAGIVWQVITLLVFGGLATDYFVRVLSRMHREHLNKATEGLRASLKFKLFCVGIVLAYFTIFTRCVFRIAEMSGGWRNSIMQDEADFIVLDGVMCTIATTCMTVFHPGYCFPLLSFSNRQQRLAEEEKMDVEQSSL